MSATIISGYRVTTRGSEKHVTFRADQKREAIVLAKRLSAKYSRTFTVQTVRTALTNDERMAEHFAEVERVMTNDLDSNGRPLLSEADRIALEEHENNLRQEEALRFDTSDVCA